MSTAAQRRERPTTALASDCELPRGWISATMGEVADVIGGGTPRTSDPANFSDKGHPWITPADLSGFEGVWITRGRRGLTDKGLRTCSATPMPKGTVLMSSRAPIGYVAIAANPLATNQGFKSFVLGPGIMPEFCFYWLKFFGPYLQEMGSGSTFPEISGSRARDIPFLIAPTAEQECVVAKIGELLAQVNAARTRLARVAQILKRFRQAVLAAACSGPLTADWRESRSIAEDGQELIKRIGEEQRQSAPNDETKLGVYASQLPGAEELPDTWAWSSFGSITKNFDGRRVPVKADDRAKRRGAYS